MLKNNLYYDCKIFCRNNYYPLVILNINCSYNKSSYTTISELYDKLFNSEILLSEIKALINQTLCIDNSDKSLNNCLIVKFLDKEKRYVCHLCKEGYFLYEETNQCIQYDNIFNCDYKNIGNKTNPIFSCKKCQQNYYDRNDEYYYNYFNFYRYNRPDQNTNKYNLEFILVKEGNINFCVRKGSYLDYCLSATVDTTYINDKYNCTSCEINYFPYYSKFYERYICQNIFEEIKTYQNFTSYVYSNYPRIETINDECPNNTLFTPDGDYCYKCNSYVGMPGCKSQCSFSLERNVTIKCLNGCLEGYIEVSEGICQSCSEINNGCEKCHYGEYPINYFGIKRKRKFVCDYCSNYDNYVLIDGKCTK